MAKKASVEGRTGPLANAKEYFRTTSYPQALAQLAQASPGPVVERLRILVTACSRAGTLSSDPAWRDDLWEVVQAAEDSTALAVSQSVLQAAVKQYPPLSEGLQPLLAEITARQELRQALEDEADERYVTALVRVNAAQSADRSGPLPSDAENLLREQTTRAAELKELTDSLKTLADFRRGFVLRLSKALQSDPSNLEAVLGQKVYEALGEMQSSPLSRGPTRVLNIRLREAVEHQRSVCAAAKKASAKDAPRKDVSEAFLILAWWRDNILIRQARAAARGLVSNLEGELGSLSELRKQDGFELPLKNAEQAIKDVDDASKSWSAARANLEALLGHLEETVANSQKAVLESLRVRLCALVNEPAKLNAECHWVVGLLRGSGITGQASPEWFAILNEQVRTAFEESRIEAAQQPSTPKGLTTQKQSWRTASARARAHSVLFAYAMPVDSPSAKQKLGTNIADADEQLKKVECKISRQCELLQSYASALGADNLTGMGEAVRGAQAEGLELFDATSTDDKWSCARLAGLIESVNLASLELGEAEKRLSNAKKDLLNLQCSSEGGLTSAGAPQEGYEAASGTAAAVNTELDATERTVAGWLEVLEVVPQGAGRSEDWPATETRKKLDQLLADVGSTRRVLFGAIQKCTERLVERGKTGGKFWRLFLEQEFDLEALLQAWKWHSKLVSMRATLDGDADVKAQRAEELGKVKEEVTAALREQQSLRQQAAMRIGTLADLVDAEVKAIGVCLDEAETSPVVPRIPMAAKPELSIDEFMSHLPPSPDSPPQPSAEEVVESVGSEVSDKEAELKDARVSSDQIVRETSSMTTQVPAPEAVVAVGMIGDASEQTRGIAVREEPPATAQALEDTPAISTEEPASAQKFYELAFTQFNNALSRQDFQAAQQEIDELKRSPTPQPIGWQIRIDELCSRLKTANDQVVASVSVPPGGTEPASKDEALPETKQSAESPFDAKARDVLSKVQRIIPSAKWKDLIGPEWYSILDSEKFAGVSDVSAPLRVSIGEGLSQLQAKLGPPREKDAGDKVSSTSLRRLIQTWKASPEPSDRDNK